MNGSSSVRQRTIAASGAVRGSGDSAARRIGRGGSLQPHSARARARSARSATCPTMTTTPPLHTPLSVTPKQHKSRRKISLPWFRQNSVSAPHSALSRQHTIDTPSSFHARLLKGGRQRQVNASYHTVHTRRRLFTASASYAAD